MVHSKSKAPQKRTASVVVLTASVVIFAVFLLSQNSGDIFKQNIASVTDPTLEQKARILSIVSSPGPLNEEQKNALFLSLSGPKMLQYQFTVLEKDMIIKALNDANTPKISTEKSSSAEESFFRFLRAHTVFTLQPTEDFLLSPFRSVII